MSDREDVQELSTESGEAVVAEDANSALASLSRQSPGVQMAVGTVPGMVTGYVFKRVSSTAAAALGGSLVVIQLASRAGYIKIDWPRLKRDTQRQWERVQERAVTMAVQTEVGGRSVHTWADAAKEFAKDNVYVSGGFVGGFLLGLASG